jgi:hypothetical protein
MAYSKKILVEGGEPKPSSPFVPLILAVVLIGASLAALYYAGFFSPRAAKAQFVCWNQDVVDSVDKCPAQPIQYCPSPTACPSAAPAVVTEQEVKTSTQTGKQAVAATVFKVADFIASGGTLTLVLENNGEDALYSNVNVVGIITTNDSEKTGDWVGSVRLETPGEKSKEIVFDELSLKGKTAGSAFSITVTIYFTNWRAEQRQEQWILKGKVE